MGYIEPKGFYSGGQWKRASRKFDSLNPADGSVWAAIDDADVNDAKTAIENAQRAFSDWSQLPFTERVDYLLKMAAEVERRRDDIVRAVQAESGGWFGKGMHEANALKEIFKAAAGEAYGQIGQVLPSASGKMSIAIRRPMGVIAIISPWNFPTLLSARQFAFPLVSGNTIVLKPSEETPYCGGLLFAEICEAVGLPAGVLNVVTCSRDNVQSVGDELIENPAVKGIAFTGSTAVGRTVAAKAGAHLKKCCIELGGKDALIICEDADLDRAAQLANFGSFMHQGQVCMSVEKLLVHEKIYEPFMAKFRERASRLKVGDPLKSNEHVIGPLINDKQAAMVRQQIEDALAKGAKAEVGGKVNGRYVEPTILTGVTPDMQVYQNETFGPVAPVIPFRSDAEAIAIANDTPYGLSSGVCTSDEQRGLAIAEALETGMSHINCSPINDEPNAPFGGSKSSGVGRYGGRWGMENFTETRWITMERGGKKIPPAF
jgi:aldehyde dehydrogenase (NAD+)